MSKHNKNVFTKSFVLIIFFVIIGLPINNLFSFIFLLLIIPIVFFSEISQKKKLLYFLSLIILLFSIFKFLFPSLTIHEGHNVVVLNNNSSTFYKENLPKEIYSFFKDEFNNHYINSQCNENDHACWKNFNPNRVYLKSSPTHNIFAFSSDWSFKEIKYSRVVKNINFSNIQSARIGAVNNLDFNFFWPENFDLLRKDIPFFVMYEISKELIDSSICWKGNIFWEKDNGLYLKQFNHNFSCTIINESQAGKFLFGTSMGTKNELVLKLEKNIKLKIKEIIELLIKALIILFIMRLFFRFNYKIYCISFLYTVGFIVIIYYVNKNLLNGFELFSGGNDGLVYMSYGNAIFNNLLNFNFYEAFRGVESVFYFPSSIRYFWQINKLFFGETVFGYLLVGYFYSIVLFFIFKKLLGTRWSVVLIIIVFLTRFFEGYALSVINVVQHINEGDAEPLAIFFLLTSLLIFLKITKDRTNFNYFFYHFLFGYSLFLSVSFRPNFLPTVLIFIIAFSFFNFYYRKKIKPSFFIGIGFLSFLLIPFHNYYYGNSFVLISSGAHHNTLAPLGLYYSAFIDLINLNWGESGSMYRIIHQLNRWIQPKEIHYIVTFIIILFLLIRKNDFIIKTICLLALSQHAVLLIYMPDNRYAYLAWILTIILNIYFVKNILLKSEAINKLKILFK